MRVDVNGNVGIGTASPAAKLDVAGTVTATAFSGSGSGLTGVAASSLSPANLTAQISTDSIAAGAVTSAKLTGSVNVTDSLVVGDTRLVVLKNGKVGIGTNTPTYGLDVQTAGANLYAAQFQNADASGSAYGVSIDITGGSAASVRPALSITTGAPGNVFEVKASGKTGLGTTSPLSRLHVAGDVKVQDTFSVQDTALVVKESGSVGIGTDTPTNPLQMASGAYVSTGGAWTNASSRSYKENINDLTDTEARDAVMALRPQRYNYKLDKDDRHVGFIAEDVPELVATKDRKGISAMDIVAVLTKVVQEQQTAIDALTKKVEALEGAR